MARLAIRATSDTSKRDKVITGKYDVMCDIMRGNVKEARIYASLPLVPGDKIRIEVTQYSDAEVVVSKIPF